MARLSRRYDWTRLPDEKLLDVRFKDLGLRLERSPLEPRIARLQHELDRRGLAFRPHFWISTDWFSPDGVPGVAVPFFVVHPRLARLERAQMFEVEGYRYDWCMQLLRHEVGHAIDAAYRLHRRKDWRKTFGSFTQKYGDTYQPRPYSKRFVLHLNYWYAQSHPAEDFAETFAVWLRPASQWRKRYEGWPARRKLEYVDRLMSEIAGRAPAVKSRERTDSIDRLTSTLRSYYSAKRKRYGDDRPDFYDRDLGRLFRPREEGVAAQGGVKPMSAERFLRKVRPRVRRQVAHWTGQFQYTIDQVLHEMIERARELDLVLVTDPSDATQEAAVMLTVQTMNYLHSGHHRVVR